MKKEIFICDICNTEFEKELSSFTLPVLHVWNSSLPYKPQILNKTLDICPACNDKIGKYIYELQQNNK